jgi:hypothetical protein
VSYHVPQESFDPGDPANYRRGSPLPPFERMDINEITVWWTAPTSKDEQQMRVHAWRVWEAQQEKPSVITVRESAPINYFVLEEHIDQEESNDVH